MYNPSKAVAKSSDYWFDKGGWTEFSLLFPLPSSEKIDLWWYCGETAADGYRSNFVVGYHFVVNLAVDLITYLGLPGPLRLRPLDRESGAWALKSTVVPFGAQNRSLYASFRYASQALFFV